MDPVFDRPDVTLLKAIPGYSRFPRCAPFYRIHQLFVGGLRRLPVLRRSSIGVQTADIFRQYLFFYNSMPFSNAVFQQFRKCFQSAILKDTDSSFFFIHYFRRFGCTISLYDPQLDDFPLFFTEPVERIPYRLAL